MNLQPQFMTFLTISALPPSKKDIGQQKFQLQIYHNLVKSIQRQKISITNLGHILGTPLDFQDIIQNQRKISNKNLSLTFPISALTKSFLISIINLSHPFPISALPAQLKKKNCVTKNLITNLSHTHWPNVRITLKSLLSNKSFNNQIKTYLANLCPT